MTGAHLSSGVEDFVATCDLLFDHPRHNLLLVVGKLGIPVCRTSNQSTCDEQRREMEMNNSLGMGVANSSWKISRKNCSFCLDWTKIEMSTSKRSKIGHGISHDG